MRILILFVIMALFAGLPANAEVLDVEFGFSPYHPPEEAQPGHVITVPGTVVVYLNKVMVAEQVMVRRELPVLFTERSISPAVWMPVRSLGSSLRKGTNSIRVEFTPADPQQPYVARFTWADVTDQVTRTGDDSGRTTVTNYSGTGKDEKTVTGRVVFERSFAADFAVDRPWHHYPPVTALSRADKARLAALLKERANRFKPDFSELYALMQHVPHLNAAEVKKADCLQKAYTAGVRMRAPAPGTIAFALSGNQEVQLHGKGGPLFPFGPERFAGIKGEEAQQCAALTLYMLYPPRLTVVRNPAGSWEVVY